MNATVAGILKDILTYQNTQRYKENQKNQNFIQKQKRIPFQNKQRIHKRKILVEILRRIKGQNGRNDGIFPKIQSVAEEKKK